MNVLILQNEGRYSRFKLADFEAAFRDLGHATAALELSAIGQAASHGKLEEVMGTLAENARRGGIETILGYSFNALTCFPNVTVNGHNQPFCNLLDIPVVNYWPDPMLETHDYLPYLVAKFDRARLCGPKVLHLVKEQPAADEMREVYGLPNVYGLPLSANTSAFRPYEGPRDIDVLFVGGSDPAPRGEMDVNALPPFDAHALEQVENARPLVARLIGLAPFSAQHKSAMKNLVRETWDRKLQDLSRCYWQTMKEVAGETGGQDALNALRVSPELYYQLRQLLIGALTLPRGYLVRNVADRFDTVVLGNETWKDWGVNYQGWADYGEQARWYSRAKIGLNHTLAWDQVGVNYKVFEITACRTLCVTNYRRQLEELFDLDRELVVYRSHDELMDKIDYYLRHDEERERIAEAGYQRTIAHHTFGHRTQAILDILQRDFGMEPRNGTGGN